MNKPAPKSVISLVSALVILLAAGVLSLVLVRNLPAVSISEDTGSEVAVPAAVQQVVCPGMPGGDAKAWVQGASATGAAAVSDTSGRVLERGVAASVGKSGLKLQAKPVAGKNVAIVGYVSGSGKEGENGFYADRCTAPTNRAYFLTPGTTTGNASTLHLVNPAGAPVTARIQIWTEQGPLRAKVTQKIPGKGSASLMLDGQAPGFTRLGVLVEAGGAGVASWVNTTLATGAQKAGAVHVSPLAAPANQVLIPAAKITGKASLRVLNPSPTVATLQVSLMNAKGETPVSSPKKLQVARGAIFDIPLGGVKDGVAAVKLRSNQPVVAAVFGEETFAGKGTLAVYPSAAASTSGAVLVNEQAANLAFVSNRSQKIILTSTNKTQEIAVKAGQVSQVKLENGVWQWQSESDCFIGQLVGDPSDAFRTIGIGKAVREVAAISVQVNP
ncbi:DUF5719 family protein [Varibaculum vaginae]|uniref:DUF5719 family protein n=1 Tax=Varibaculum vaginae TaxID=2364797 RepID=UPI000F08AAF4|nr:DUF5719 family protein [Varibaculum vaginae]